MEAEGLKKKSEWKFRRSEIIAMFTLSLFITLITCYAKGISLGLFFFVILWIIDTAALYIVVVGIRVSGKSGSKNITRIQGVRFCIKCGAMVYKGDTFCKKCGTHFEEGETK